MDTNPTTPPNGNTGPSHKYIRTFAGDMKTIQEGGMPTLEPFEKQQVEEPPSHESPVRDETSAEPRLDPLKTYKGDFSDRIKETSASTSSILAAEQDAPRGAIQSIEESPRGGRVFIIVGVVLLLVGIAGASFAYVHYANLNAPVVVEPTIATPIFVDERAEVAGSGALLMQSIEQSIARPPSSGNIRLLHFPANTASSTDSVFTKLLLPAPGVLLRNIDSTQSMAGVINVAGTASPFFILSVASYSQTFAGMLSWETVMPRDFARLFPPLSPVATTPTNQGGSVASSTGSAASSTPLQEVRRATFYDEVVRNHDVRVYRDEAGRGVFLYGYWNQQTLVIARDAAAFGEILERLGTSRTQTQ